jgi:hypothetical protein
LAQPAVTNMLVNTQLPGAMARNAVALRSTLLPVVGYCDEQALKFCLWGRAASTADPVTTLRYQGDDYLLPASHGLGCVAPASCTSAATPPAADPFSTSWELHCRLHERADREGRSLSNLISLLLEAATS